MTSRHCPDVPRKSQMKIKKCPSTETSRERCFAPPDIQNRDISFFRPKPDMNLIIILSESALQIEVKQVKYSVY